MNSPRLKKRFGQHHLRSGQLCRPAIEFLAPQDQRVLEIGAGDGVLTAELTRAGARVWTLEIDLDWVFRLRQQAPLASGITSVAMDALNFPWQRLPSPTLLAGNLPFNVATQVIEQVLPLVLAVPRAAFMLQKEVAERLVAQPGDAAYGALSVLVRAQARTTRLGTIPATSFRPPPKVSAAFVGLTLVPPPLPPAEIAAFSRVVRLAFAFRRKTLHNALGAAWGRTLSHTVLATAGIDPQLRAQALSLEQFVALYQAWKQAI